MEKESLFMHSVKKHQQLIDVLLNVQNESGVSVISQAEIALRMDRSQTWVTKAIKRLNLSGSCIEMIFPGQYIVHYSDILSCGTFCEIMRLIAATQKNSKLFFEKDNILSAKFHTSLPIVQMYKSYLRTGWKNEAHQIKNNA